MPQSYDFILKPPNKRVGEDGKKIWFSESKFNLNETCSYKLLNA